jgi:hypothetical protein
MKMKNWLKSNLKLFGSFTLGLLALIFGSLFFCAIIFPVVTVSIHFHRQMVAAQKYMDSLTDKDFQVWMARTQKYLSEFDSKDFTRGSKPVPPELRQLNIVRIDESTNCIGYVWVVRVAPTELLVERMNNGCFMFTARYNEREERIIKTVWPETVSTNKSESLLPTN